MKSQIAKARALLETGEEVMHIVWHVFRSPTTGKIGPSGPLRDALRRAGIIVIEHFNL